ncbi:MAG: M13 family metallopeptidase [Dokdonella sp.]
MRVVTAAADLHELIGAPIEPVRFDASDLDPSASAAIDLDAFVNARWRAANPLPPDRSSWDCFTILHERSLQIQAGIAFDAAAGANDRSDSRRVVGDLWSSGLHAVAEVSAHRLREELLRIDALDTPAAIAAYLCDRHARGWPLLFGFDVDVDFDDPRATIACISQAGLGLPDRDLYVDASAAALRDAYAAHIAALLQWGDSASAQTHELAAVVIAFETRLASASLPRKTLARDIAQRQRRIALAAADRLNGVFRWSDFFTAQGVAPPVDVSLAMPMFQAEWNAMLIDVPAAAWRAYFTFHTIASLASALGGELAQQQHRFYGETLRGQKQPIPRWKQVLETINVHVADALGELYVAHTFSESAWRRAEELVERLRSALRARIGALDWMSEATKAQALVKLDAMRAKIGHPVRWHDWSGLATSPDDWLGNLLAARAFEQRRVLAKLGRAVDADEWSMAAQTVNAGYDPQRNEIVFPAAILQPPFFDANADDALNYGGIGAVIAHEMTHGFDDQGSRFGADGRLQNWWNDGDRARFEAKTQQLVDLFDAATIAGGEHVDGRLTLGENIADFGGLAIAWDAHAAALAENPASDPMLDGYDQRQRFFFAWATIWRQILTPAEARTRLRFDAHAPAALRANAAPSNMVEFGETFAHTCGTPRPIRALQQVRVW